MNGLLNKRTLGPYYDIVEASWLVGSPPFEPWPGTLRCILGQTLNSLSASLQPGIQFGSGEFNAGGSTAMD